MQITQGQHIQETPAHICHFQYSETNAYIKYDSALKIKTCHVKVLLYHKIHWNDVSVFLALRLHCEEEMNFPYYTTEQSKLQTTNQEYILKIPILM